MMLGGPHVGFSGGAGGGAKFYASLTGVGETTTPGALTQKGDFTVTSTAPTTFALLSVTAGTATYPHVEIFASVKTSTASIVVATETTTLFPHITLTTIGPTALVQISGSTGTNTSTIYVTPARIRIKSKNIVLLTLPTSTAGLIAGSLWRTGNTVKIVI